VPDSLARQSIQSTASGAGEWTQKGRIGIVGFGFRPNCRLLGSYLETPLCELPLMRDNVMLTKPAPVEDCVAGIPQTARSRASGRAALIADVTANLEIGLVASDPPESCRV
jgi:hypothetical protein